MPGCFLYWRVCIEDMKKPPVLWKNVAPGGVKTAFWQERNSYQMKIGTYYVCRECGYRSAKYFGRCPGCGGWDTLEQNIKEDKKPEVRTAYSRETSYATASLFSEIDDVADIRSKSGMPELDRVLGGGIVRGSVILMAGEPGIGKSTLLMQISGSLSSAGKVLYISAEESGSQLKYRAQRLGIDDKNVYVLTETSVDAILSECERISPDYIIVDSIQTVSLEKVPSSAGSVAQVRESAARFIELAKKNAVSVLMVGHVNKEGSIAGPKVLEHMVDAVLNFEGDRRHVLRLIRASKNRYGATNEIGAFEMTDRGLQEVKDPSGLFLSDKPSGVPGTCAVCLVEGTRPLITEIQALTTQSVYPSPRRTSDGIDYNRMCILLALLEKRLGLRFSTLDTYVNVIGGIRPEEPAADLPLALALISSFKDIPFEDSLVAFGEVGLAGECRAVDMALLRVREAVKLGFNRIVLPYKNYDEVKKAFDTGALPAGLTLIPVKSIFDALKVFTKSGGS